MSIIPVHLFKDSFGPFIKLLNEHEIKYTMREIQAGVPVASGGTLEIIQAALSNPAFWPSLAGVVAAFIKVRSSRKVIITTKNGTVVHAEGLTQAELEQVLQQAQSFTAIETGKGLTNDESTSK